jgi:hypothetical protein
VREPIVFGPLQHLAQVRSLLREHDEDLIEIEVGGGPRDAMVTGGDAVAEPPEPSTAYQKQPSARLPRGLPRRPPFRKRGTIDDHVEPFVKVICGETSSTGGFGQSGLSACLPRCSRLGGMKPTCPNLFLRITSLTNWDTTT